MYIYIYAYPYVDSLSTQRVTVYLTPAAHPCLSHFTKSLRVSFLTLDTELSLPLNG